MKSFNHNTDLLRFTTECLTALLALQLVLADIPDSDEDKDQYLLDSRPIVEMVRQQVSARDVEAVIDTEDDDDQYYEYCFCKEH